jgi:hypothetical protein
MFSIRLIDSKSCLRILNRRMTDDTTTHPADPAARSGLILWTIGCAVAAAALAALFGTLPARAKLLGLSPIFFGAACGFLVSQLAVRLDQPRSRFRLLLPACLAMLGFAAVVHLSFKTFQRESKSDKSELFQRQLALQMLKSTENPDSDLIRRYETDLAGHSPNRQTFLTRRVAPLGRWTWPWPAVFFGGELLLAAASAVIVSRWLWIDPLPSQSPVLDSKTVSP